MEPLRGGYDSCIQTKWLQSLLTVDTILPSPSYRFRLLTKLLQQQQQQTKCVTYIISRVFCGKFCQVLRASLQRKLSIFFSKVQFV